MAMSMNTNMDILVLLSITSLLLLSAPTILAHKQSPLTISPRQQRLLRQLNEICNKTGHPSLCTNSFLQYYNQTSSFSTATRVEPVTVLYAVVESTSEWVQRAVAEVRRLRNDTSFGGALLSQLGVCEEVYGSVVVDLRTAVDGILTKDLFTLFTSLPNVGITARACGEALKIMSFEKVEVVEVMREFDERVSQMGVVCWDLAHMLNWSLHD